MKPQRKKKRSIQDIILPNADWKVKKIDFNSPEIQDSLKELRKAQEESFNRPRQRVRL